jgi:hypothetical protein
MKDVFIIIVVIALIGFIIWSSLSYEGFQEKQFITGNLVGGLANRIFIVMAVKGFAEKTNRTPVFVSKYIANNDHQSKESTINELKEIFPDMEIRDDLSWTEANEEREFQYTDILADKINDNIVLHGYFQNEGYFPSNLPTLQKTLLPNTVFLHIRLGDYTGTRHDVGLTKYYVECLTRLKDDNKKFLVFSNDNTKAEEYIKSLNIPFIYTISEKMNALDVLKEMASCSGAICSNSSLSWMGAFFQAENRGPVFMPGKWIDGIPKENFNTFYPSWATVIDI